MHYTTKISANHATELTTLSFLVADSTGCYYNFQHYDEGDRIITNEPCLNCTCHNRMLMCYLRVCPFTKAIGQDCTVEKRPDQCCPVITCPEGWLESPKTSSKIVILSSRSARPTSHVDHDRVFEIHRRRPSRHLRLFDRQPLLFRRRSCTIRSEQTLRTLLLHPQQDRLRYAGMHLKN